jgi:polygalacturonase
MGTDVGLRFKSNRGRGGVVENIFISDIRMTNIPTHAISFDLFYGGQSISEMLESGAEEGFAKPEPVSEETPQFKNISIRNITLKGAMQAVFMQGLPEMNLENIRFNNMVLEADNGFSLVDAKDIELENIDLQTKSETAFEIYNVGNLVFKNVRFDSKGKSAIKINGEKCTGITFDSVQGKEIKSQIAIGGEVPEGAVQF